MTASLKLDTSLLSTCTIEPFEYDSTKNIDSYNDLDTILDQIPFIAGPDPDLWGNEVMLWQIVAANWI